MRTKALLAFGGVAAAALALTGCAGDKAGGAKAAAGDAKIAVTATDTDCQLAKTEAASGPVTFTVTNKGNKVTEFYVYASGDRIMGEIENVAPGLNRELVVELPAGTYETSCRPGMSGKGIRGAFKATGESKALNDNAKLAQATQDYQRYVKSQTGGLIDKTTEFVNAVKAGDVEKAKAMYPVARTYWERIEPVAESFGDLDPAVDAREGDVEAGQEWTGYHKLEQDLWVAKDVSRSGPIADKLLTDVKTIVSKAETVQLTALQLANGAKELLDEVATRKITGEEDRYSHTDLWDFAANLEGSQAAVAALRPVIEEKDAALAKTLQDKFAAAQAELDKYRSGDGWKLHNTLTPDELKQLAAVINGLAEPISRVAPLVAAK